MEGLAALADALHRGTVRRGPSQRDSLRPLSIHSTGAERNDIDETSLWAALASPSRQQTAQRRV